MHDALGCMRVSLDSFYMKSSMLQMQGAAYKSNVDYADMPKRSVSGGGGLACKFNASKGGKRLQKIPLPH